MRRFGFLCLTVGSAATGGSSGRDTGDSGGGADTADSAGTGDTACGPARTWYTDADNDGYGDASLPIDDPDGCLDPALASLVAGDCDDTNYCL